MTVVMTLCGVIAGGDDGRAEPHRRRRPGAARRARLHKVGGGHLGHCTWPATRSRGVLRAILGPRSAAGAGYPRCSRVPETHNLRAATVITVCPVEADGEDDPPLGGLHVVTAVQPNSLPTSDENLARIAVLDNELEAAGIRAIRAVGISFDGSHREESRAVFGLDDAEARCLGRRFGQVAVFAWTGPRWSLLAWVGDRRTDAGGAGVRVSEDLRLAQRLPLPPAVMTGSSVP